MNTFSITRLFQSVNYYLFSVEHFTIGTFDKLFLNINNKRAAKQLSKNGKKIRF